MRNPPHKSKWNLGRGTVQRNSRTCLSHEFPPTRWSPTEAKGTARKTLEGKNLVTSDGPLAKQGPSFPFRASPKPHAEQKKEGKRPASVPKRVPKANLCRSSARIRHTQRQKQAGANGRPRSGPADHSHYPQRLPGQLKSNATEAAEGGLSGSTSCAAQTWPVSMSEHRLADRARNSGTIRPSRTLKRSRGNPPSSVNFPCRPRRSTRGARREELQMALLRISNTQHDAQADVKRENATEVLVKNC